MSTTNPFRFSLRTLLLAVVAVSVGTAAMVSASEWWQAFVMAITVVLLIASILLVAYRSGSARAYWSGFAVSGGMYLMLWVFQFDVSPNNMLTGKLLDLLAGVMHQTPDYATAVPIYGATAVNSGPPTLAPIPGPVIESTPQPADGPKLGDDCTTPTDSSTCGSGDSDEPARLIPADDSSLPAAVPSGSIAQGYSPAILPAQPAPTVIYSSSRNGTTYYSPYPSPYDDVDDRRERCISIGHCLWTIIFGMAGGSFAVWLHATRDKGREATT